MVDLLNEFGLLNDTSYQIATPYESVVWNANYANVSSIWIYRSYGYLINDSFQGGYVKRSMQPIQWIMANLNISDVPSAMAKLYQDSEKYINLHHNMFGTYENLVRVW